MAGGHRDAAHGNFLGPEVLESTVGKVIRTELAHHLAGQRTPQPDAAGAAGDVRDVHPLCRVARRLLARLNAEVVKVHIAVHAKLELFLRQTRHGHIAADAPVVRQEQSVRHGTRGAASAGYSPSWR